MSGERNQCDGCCQGNEPDKDGMHRDSNGRTTMFCTADRYRKVTKKQAMEALDNMDDYARMADIDPIGPHATLKRFIEQQEEE